jgi:hypothetical protein
VADDASDVRPAGPAAGRTGDDRDHRGIAAIAARQLRGDHLSDHLRTALSSRSVIDQA